MAAALHGRPRELAEHPAAPPCPFVVPTAWGIGMGYINMATRVVAKIYRPICNYEVQYMYIRYIGMYMSHFYASTPEPPHPHAVPPGSTEPRTEPRNSRGTEAGDAIAASAVARWHILA